MTNGFWGGDAGQREASIGERGSLQAVAGKRRFQFWDGLDRKWEIAGPGGAQTSPRRLKLREATSRKPLGSMAGSIRWQQAAPLQALGHQPAVRLSTGVGLGH